MNIFYADDTHLKESKSDSFPKIHIFGGVIVSRDHETEIIEEMRRVKEEYTHPNMPIKWNFRDSSIKEKFREFKREDDYQKMLQDSREWRLKIFRLVDHIPYRILISCISSFASTKEAQTKVRNDLSTYCFENVLMRLGLDAKELKGHWQCVLDWPPGNQSKPFDAGYYTLFHYGKGFSGTVSKSGKLEALGFSHSLHFTRCNHSPMIQFTDMVIGATRDHIECMVQGRDSCLGSEVVEIIYNHFRNRNGVIPRYGVVASTGSKDLSEQVGEIFKKKANKRCEPTSPLRGFAAPA